MKTYTIKRGRRLVGEIRASNIDAARRVAIQLDPKNRGATVRRKRSTVRPAGGYHDCDTLDDVDPRDYAADTECVDCGCDPCECWI